MNQRFEKRMINVILANHLDKKNVVWVQSGNDFVDLLYSFLTLPLGTIVRLLENQAKTLQQKVTIGCLNNLYKSVVDMSIDHFRTEACKQMLIYPRSVKEGLCRKLKINIDDTEATKYFMCPMSMQRKSCGEFFSNFTSRCNYCGNLMNKEIPSPEGEECARDCYDYDDGVFVHGDGNVAFMVSDDLKTENFSWDLFRGKVKNLGCFNVLVELGQGEAEIGFREAMTLLRSLFTSETPLTSTFFPFDSLSYPPLRAYKPASPCEPVLGQVLSLKVYLSKQDEKKVVYVECGEGFIDLLCTFLVLPLEYICEISRDEDDGLGCIGNLFRSFKGLSCGEITIPWYYSCRKNLLGITVQNQPSFYRCINDEDRLKNIVAIDPKIEKSGQQGSSGGFVKSKKKFLVSDDLRNTPLKSGLTVRELNDMKIGPDDVKIELITIGRAEAINLLKSSFVTSSALTNGLSDLLAKKLEG